MKKSIKSVRKWIVLGLGILIIGGLIGYAIAIHHQNRRKPCPFHDRMIESMFDRPMLRHNDFDDMFDEFEDFDDFDDFDDMFEDMRKKQDRKMKRLRDNFGAVYDMDSHLEDLILTGDYDSRGAFKYYEKKNINGDESSYNVQGNWNQGEDTGNIVVSGNDNDKTFSYSGNFKDGESEGILVDSEGNTTETTLSEVLKRD